MQGQPPGGQVPFQPSPFASPFLLQPDDPPLLLSTSQPGGPPPPPSFQEQQQPVPSSQQAAAQAKHGPRHPSIVLVHLGLKTAGLLTYLFCGLFGSGSFVINFVAIALLQAGDFWFVKNVSGRKLIGLRYWNFTNEAGENEWQFECRDGDGMALIVPDEKRMFWTTLYIQPLVWVLFSLTSLLKVSLGYLMLCLMGFMMSMTNAIGFYKSSKEARAEISAGVSRFTAQYVRSSLLG